MAGTFCLLQEPLSCQIVCLFCGNQYKFKKKGKARQGKADDGQARNVDTGRPSIYKSIGEMVQSMHSSCCKRVYGLALSRYACLDGMDWGPDMVAL